MTNVHNEHYLNLANSIYQSGLRFKLNAFPYPRENTFGPTDRTPFPDGLGAGYFWVAYSVENEYNFYVKRITKGDDRLAASVPVTDEEDLTPDVIQHAFRCLLDDIVESVKTNGSRISQTGFYSPLQIAALLT